MFILQLSNVLHAIANTDSVYRTSMENLIKVIDGMNKRVTYVEKNEMHKNSIIDSKIIENLNISVEALERKNREISQSLEQTKFGLSQLSGQLDVARNQKVSTLLKRKDEYHTYTQSIYNYKKIINKYFEVLIKL